MGLLIELFIDLVICLLFSFALIGVLFASGAVGGFVRKSYEEQTVKDWRDKDGFEGDPVLLAGESDECYTFHLEEETFLHFGTSDNESFGSKASGSDVESALEVTFLDVEIGDETYGRSGIQCAGGSDPIQSFSSRGGETEVDADDSAGIRNEEEVGNNDEDWEGINNTELEKRFASAVALFQSQSKADRISRLDNAVKQQLHALYKLALEGPCQGPPPTALKVSARARWNAWNLLGKMSPEEAMEQYISLLKSRTEENPDSGTELS